MIGPKHAGASERGPQQAFFASRWHRGALSLSLPMLAIASACQIIGGYESFEPGDGAAPNPCGALPSSKLDAKNLGTLVLTTPPYGSCYWIDKYEVTVDQYSKFVAAAGTQAVAWNAERCSWKSKPSDPANQPDDTCAAMAIKMESEPFRSTKPIRCIDWCDAKAFCNWAGKDLCGGITNGSFVTPSDVPDEWGYACSANGLAYVGGSMPEAGLCNVGLQDQQCISLYGETCAPTDVGAFSGCKGPSGAINMIGNVAEWVTLCSNLDDGGTGTPCQHRGGSFAGSLTDETCWAQPSNARSFRDRSLGLRCCAHLTPDEMALQK
jgi:formylglycine-generating enzyme